MPPTQHQPGPVTIGGVDYERVYVSELEAGDVTPFGETIASVERKDGRVYVKMESDHTVSYRRADATTLIVAK